MKQKNTEVLVIGAGPSGLSAAISCRRAGAQVLLVDSNLKAGGQLFKQIHKFFGSSAHRAGIRGIDIGRELWDEAVGLGIEIWLNSTAIAAYADRSVAIVRGLDTSKDKELYMVSSRTVVLGTGASENAIRFEGWDLPGVMGAGAVQTMINVNRVLPGREVLMVGSGNVGLIVSYQLMLAGAKVVRLVEAAPKIGGYGVHAAKIVRAGVQIQCSHTVIKAIGTERVKSAVICELDHSFRPVPNTEEEIECDVIALAVGMTPIAKLTRMFGCEMMFIPAFSGWVPIHSELMESSRDGVFVVGDATGIEEANTALEEGRLAGVGVALKLGYIGQDAADQEKDAIWGRLDSLRAGSHGIVRQNAKKDQVRAYEEYAGYVK